MISLLVSVGVAVFVALFGTPLVIRYFRNHGIGQQIREDGPEGHHSKAGTPTMGGLMIVAGTVAGYTVSHILRKETIFTRGGLLVLMLVVGGALVGGLDDYIKVTRERSLGLNKRAKSAGLLILAFAFAWLGHVAAKLPVEVTLTRSEGFGITLPTWLWALFVVVLVVGSTNAVNLTDGLDGLAAGSSAFAASAFVVVGFWQFRHVPVYDIPQALDLAILAAALMGGCIGFLWWNAAPAQIFMGDTGALAIGAGLAGLSLATGTPLLLAVVGGLFVAETLSVIVQIIAFRVFKRRVFRMTPIHHHFEHLDPPWPETTIIIRFWIIAGALTAGGLGVFYYDYLRECPRDSGVAGLLVDQRPTRGTRFGTANKGGTTSVTAIAPANVRTIRADTPSRSSAITTSTGVIVTALALTFVGLVMILSSSSVFALRENQSVFHFVGRQAIWVALGLAAMVGGRRIDHRVWRRLAAPVLGVTLGLLVAVLVIGRSAYGARRWFEAGPLNFQPSEFAKLALAVFLADLLTRRADRIGEWRHALRPVIVVTSAVVGLVMLQPDMGTSICLLLVVFGVVFAAAMPVRHIAGFGGAVVAAGVVLAWLEPYRRARLLSYRRPFEAYAGDGYQVAQALLGLGSGGPAGTGLGQGRAKWGFLPNAHTDFIFAVIGEETGLIGTGLVLGLFIVLAGLGFRTAMRAPDRFGSLLAAGITSWLVGQAALNIGTTVGLVPVTGVPLPFISFGGSALVISLFSAGVLASIAHASEK